MPDITEVNYCHETTVRAFRNCYKFLVDFYMDEVEIIEPPPGGWPSISQDFQKCFGKSDEVIALLRDLPYIQEDWHNDGPAQGSAHCTWADWQAQATMSTQQWADKITHPEIVIEGEISIEETLKVMSEGYVMWEDMPSHVIGLTFGRADNSHFLLDTQLGIVYLPGDCGGGDHDGNWENEPNFIEPVWGWEDPEENLNDDEPTQVHWREEQPAWAIEDFFELLKTQFRKLKWIPISPREVFNITSTFGEGEEGLVPMLQDIYRQHGWELEEGENYRKQSVSKQSR